MGTYILLLFFALGHDDSNSTTSIPGFVSEASCIDAGKKSKKLVIASVKEINYVCLYQPK